MSYRIIAVMARDSALRDRIVASAAEENKTRPYEDWAAENIWDIVSEPGWSAAWDSAVAGGNQNPGNDEAVITDGMILAAVQPLP